MLFNSYAFLLVFLPIAIAICVLIDGRPGLRIPILIVLSFVFYGYWDVRFVPLLACSIVINWAAAYCYVTVKRAPWIITTTIAANLAVLAFFKYWNFLAGNLNGIPGVEITHLDLALPLGISFFTFHHVMYLVDLRRGIAPPVPLDKYALYICFFPQVLSGPLVRWSEVIHQFGEAMLRPGWQRRFATGVAFIVIGLMEKSLLGDTLGQTAGPVFDMAERGPVTAGQAWGGVLSFTFQIFFDFAGYTDIAIGLALIFGIQLPLNFNGPYRAASPRDFWRRWHMTLSRFLRDYLYIPLGGNRHGLPVQMYALLVTMALGGLWHGAGWNFLIWGVLHGLALAAGVLWRRTMPPMPSPIGWVLTFSFVTFAWIFFRSASLTGAMNIISSLGAMPGPRIDGLRTIAIAAFCAIALPPSHLIVARLTQRPNRTVAAALACASILILVTLGHDATHEFIYFQF